MKVFQVTGLIFCFVISSLAFGQGTVIHEQFYSESLERTQDVNVYVPEDYEPDSTRILYPVIYLLHGGGVNYTYYSEIVAALDSLISIEIEPVIVVRPNGFYGPYSGMSWWSNSELNGQFEDYVVSDLVEFIESNYNASPERDKRCIMGHSMGGYGAMMIALKHTDIYCGVVSFSGVVHSTYTVQTYYIPDMLNEHGGSGPFSPDAGGYSTVIYSMAAAFSPNLDNPPYNLDLPVDDEGNIVDEVFDLWIHEDPAWLATQLDDEDSIAIYIDALDGEAFPIINRAFADTLDAYEIPYTMRVFPGRDHHRDLPQRYPASLTFLDSVMWASAEDKVSANPLELLNGYKLHSVYPNPFNPEFTVTVELPESAELLVHIFNINGRNIRTLVNGNYPAGTHHLTLNTGNLSSGIYFVQAEVQGKMNEIRKVILIR